MNARRLGAAAIAALALVPITVSADSSPTPEQLRAALADPVDTSYLDVDGTSPAMLVGPFDAGQYANTFATSDQNGVLVALEEAGFAAGYGRRWYRPSSSKRMSAIVMVFATAAGAQQISDSSYDTYQKTPGFQSLVDISQIPDAYALNTSQSNYEWTVVVFVKGNAMYAVLGGAPSETLRDTVVAQAERQYTVAPARFEVSGRPPTAVTGSSNPFARYTRLLLVGAILFAITVAVALIAVGYVVVRAQRRPPVPIEARSNS